MDEIKTDGRAAASDEETKKQASGKKPEKRPARKSRKKRKAEKKKHPVLRRILAGVLTLLLIALAVLVFVFRDRLDNESLRESFGKTVKLETAGEAFAYESGNEQVFVTVGDGLAVASGSAIQLLNAEGETVWKQIVSYDAPAVFAAKQQALFCNLGGKTAITVNMDGESSELKTDEEIVTAAMNDNGWFVLVTEATGYKSLVRVYNDARELRYEWWSGSGYVLRAAVSPDNKCMAALCADGEGTKLHLFSLSREEELAVVSFPQELDFDLRFFGSDTVCCIGEQKLHFVDTDGKIRGEYDLGDYYLMDYDFGSDNFVTLFVSAYRTGTGGLLMTVDRSGQLIGCVEESRNVISLCASGKQVLVMTAGSLTLYGQDLAQQEQIETLMTAKKAVLQPNGTILLLSAYAAEKFQF